ncbi:ATPase [Weeksellaceae bacterium TAE3-ERU29]|nr:ATPase [Weeksellaceae bacterium TAE3-ERU29]
MAVAIIESGSTKSDWVVLNNDYQEIVRTQTIGFNPIFVKSEDIHKEIIQNQDLYNLADEINQVYFYGAGIRSLMLRSIVKSGFSKVFNNAEIFIDTDLKAACFSAYNGNPVIVCILGTGSNSCFFNGKEIEEITPSLGYVLGDEGSGNHFGRILIRDFFTHKMPTDLQKSFQDKYRINKDEVIEKVYKNAFPNAYLATFSKFVAENKEHSYIKNVIYKCLDEFFIYQVLPYPQKTETEINFIGSIAYYYQEILEEIAEKYHLKIGQIIQKPINNLVEYHKNYILK